MRGCERRSGRGHRTILLTQLICTTSRCNDRIAHGLRCNVIDAISADAARLSIYLSICHLSVCLSDNVIRLFLGVLDTIHECRGRTRYTMVTPFDASIIFHGGCSKVRLETQVQSRAYTPSPTVNESNYSDLRLMTYISETVTLRSLKEGRLSQHRTTNISLKISDFCVDIYDDMETVPLQ